jgi:hypothetical protein
MFATEAGMIISFIVLLMFVLAVVIIAATLHLTNKNAVIKRLERRARKDFTSLNKGFIDTQNAIYNEANRYYRR